MNNKGTIGAFASLGALLIVVAFFVGQDWAVTRQAVEAVDRLTDRQQAYAEDLASRECANLSGKALTDCATEAVTRSREYGISEQDLAAQERMASYAGWALILSSVGSAVAGLGIIFVARTLTATENGHKDSNRAYIQVEEAELKWGSEDAERVQITLTAQNTGETPAIYFTVKCVCIILEDMKDKFDIEEARSELKEMAGSTWMGFPANSKQTFPGLQREKDLEALQRHFKHKTNTFPTIKKKIPIRLVGTIQYKTFFGEVFESEFSFGRLVFGFQMPELDPSSKKPNGNEIPWKFSKMAGNRHRVYDRVN